MLIWHAIPTSNAQPADVVLGQPDFDSNLPNVKGIGNDPTAHTLNWPYGLFSDGKSLWIADTGNRRILFYNDIPSENYTAADKVTESQPLQLEIIIMMNRYGHIQLK